jgi:hypothetical protein
VLIRGDRFRARAHGRERGPRGPWRMMNGIWRHDDEYQTRTERQIPVVVLERL